MTYMDKLISHEHFSHENFHQIFNLVECHNSCDILWSMFNGFSKVTNLKFYASYNLYILKKSMGRSIFQIIFYGIGKVTFYVMVNPIEVSVWERVWIFLCLLHNSYIFLLPGIRTMSLISYGVVHLRVLSRRGFQSVRCQILTRRAATIVINYQHKC